MQQLCEILIRALTTGACDGDSAAMLGFLVWFFDLGWGFTVVKLLMSFALHHVGFAGQGADPGGPAFRMVSFLRQTLVPPMCGPCESLTSFSVMMRST